MIYGFLQICHQFQFRVKAGLISFMQMTFGSIAKQSHAVPIQHLQSFDQQFLAQKLDEMSYNYL